MGVNSLPKTVTRQRRGCGLNPGRSAPESSTQTTRLVYRRCVCVNLYASVDYLSDERLVALACIIDHSSIDAIGLLCTV